MELVNVKRVGTYNNREVAKVYVYFIDICNRWGMLCNALYQLFFNIQLLFTICL